MNRPRLIFAAMALLFVASRLTAQDPFLEDPPEDRPASAHPAPARVDKKRFAKVRGVNYVPSYAASSYEIWTNYDGKVIRKELAAASGLGLTSVRIFLNAGAYEEKPTTFVQNFDDFLKAAHEVDLTVMPVLFDATGVDPSSNSEGREPVAKAFDRFLSRPESYRIHSQYERYLKTFARELAPSSTVPVSKDPGSVFWGDWTPTPGHDGVAKEDRFRYEDYLKGVIGAHTDNPTILAWDIMNEPDSIRAFSGESERATAADFAVAMLQFARGLGPRQPLTIGASGGLEGSRRYRLQVDVLSLHIYQKKVNDLRSAIADSAKQAQGKPVLLTECGAVILPVSKNEASESAQEDAVAAVLAASRAESSGFFLWHLVEGKIRAPWTALLKPDLSPKSAALTLRKELADEALIGH